MSQASMKPWIAVHGDGTLTRAGLLHERCPSTRDSKQCAYVEGHGAYHCDAGGNFTWALPTTPDDKPTKAEDEAEHREKPTKAERFSRKWVALERHESVRGGA